MGWLQRKTVGHLCIADSEVQRGVVNLQIRIAMMWCRMLFGRNRPGTGKLGHTGSWTLWRYVEPMKLGVQEPWQPLSNLGVPLTTRGRKTFSKPRPSGSTRWISLSSTFFQSGPCRQLFCDETSRRSSFQKLRYSFITARLAWHANKSYWPHDLVTTHYARIPNSLTGLCSR